MSDDPAKVSVLLGAGASVASGIPAARQMLDEITTRTDLFEDSIYGADPVPFHALVRYVWAALEAASERRGEASGQIEIEAVGNAIAALAARSAYPAEPFLAGWNPTVAEVDKLYDSSKASSSESILLWTIANHIRQLGEQLAPSAKAEDRPYTPVTNGFGLAQRDFLEAVRKLACVKEEDEHRTRYLAELFRLHTDESPLTIATLNYDRTIEIAAKNASVPLDTGIDSFDNARQVAFGDGAIRLLKIHGSEDWCRNVYGGSYRGIDKEVVWERRDVAVPHFRRPSTDEGRPEPGIIFGGENKLTAEGPFFELFRLWRQALQESDTLLIVGYSFRDPHVNVTIERFGGRREPEPRFKRRIVVCDTEPAERLA